MTTNAIKQQLQDLRLPLIAAPMFLSSGPDLVVSCCTAGIVGTLPAHNQRSAAGFEEWVIEIKQRLVAHAEATGTKPAPYGVNLLVHKSNAKLQEEIEVCIRQETPIIITSLGAVRDLVERIHDYGGLVFHDVINLRHARKAAEAGVDGLVAVCAGAGGHTGNVNPFGLMHEIKAFYDGIVILSGALSSGDDIAAAQMMGADFAYMGTRFIATKEALSPDDYKDMVVTSVLADILTTPAVTGVNANFITTSLEKAGIDPDDLSAHGALNINDELADALRESNESKPWRDIWSAGHGVGGIDDIPHVSDMIERMRDEYQAAISAQVERAKAFADK